MLELLMNNEKIKNLIFSERMTVCEAAFEFPARNPLDYHFFKQVVQTVPLRDKIKIVLQNASEDILVFSNDISVQGVDDAEYQGYIADALEDEDIEVKLEIYKKIEDEHFSIYNFEKFTEDLLSLRIEEILRGFSEQFKFAENRIIFELFDQTKMFATKTMYFVPVGNDAENTEFERSKRIESCKAVSYFYNFDLYEMIPDDFKIEIDYEQNPLRNLFNKITSLLSICFIASSSSLDEEEVKGQINGHRTMQFNNQIENIQHNQVLYKVYKWIYTDGNVIDKALIARNIISLHCQYIPILSVDEKVLASIQSNFNLYLRDNVNQYLELRNDIAKFISEIISKTGEYATETLEKFKSNLIAIFGFLFTVILANIVSTQPLDNIFTKDITAIMECVLLGSGIFLFISYLQSRYQIEKVDESYDQLKKNYEDVLTKEDIQEIFKNDEMMEKAKTTIKKSRRIYLIIWVAFLVSAFIASEQISTSPIITPILKSFWKLVCKN